MKFEELLRVFPEQRLWGATDGDRTYVISFDAKHPERGYESSWSRPRCKPTPIGTSYTMHQAVAACRAFRRRKDN